MQPPESLPSYQHDDWISSVSISSNKYIYKFKFNDQFFFNSF